MKEIPAQICMQCGEAYFDEHTTEEIYNLTIAIPINVAEWELVGIKAPK